MHILVFGGTFNPPHLGHQLMVEQVLLDQLPDGRSVDQVWLLPVGQHSFTKEFVAAWHRIAMLELLKLELVQQHGLSWNKKILIEECEIKQVGESQTFSTLNWLAQQFPKHHFSFLIGSDNLAQFHRWHHYQSMLQNYPFYVYPRHGYALEPLYPGMIALDNVAESQVSSTRVRQALLRGEDLSPWLNKHVIKYIQREGLFQSA